MVSVENFAVRVENHVKRIIVWNGPPGSETTLEFTTSCLHDLY